MSQRQYWNYTETMRHRIVISHFGDIRLPTPWTLPQAGTFAGLLVAMFYTRRFWVAWIGEPWALVQVVIALAVPYVLASALALVGNEGRNPLVVVASVVATRTPKPGIPEWVLARRCRQRVRFVDRAPPPSR